MRAVSVAVARREPLQRMAILNRQKKVRLALGPLRAFLRKTQRELDIAGSEITIALVSDEEIAGWNAAYRKKKGPTDVLSFPATAGVIEGARGKKSTRARLGSFKRRRATILGDIAIAPETAARYATKNGRSLVAEIRLLMLHGVLHLMGYDHESDNGQMNRIEQKLRRRLGIARAAIPGSLRSAWCSWHPFCRFIPTWR
jgi:probable rRNA maturation factor